MCFGALRRSKRCFNQQSLLTASQPKCVTQPSRTALQCSTQSQCCPVNGQHKTTVAKSQRIQVKVNVEAWFLCQKMRIEEIEVLGEFQVSLTKRWPKSMLVNSALETLEQSETLHVFLSHVWVKRSLQDDDRTNQMQRENVWWVMDENDLQCWPIYIHQWRCVTHLLGLQA